MCRSCRSRGPLFPALFEHTSLQYDHQQQEYAANHRLPVRRQTDQAQPVLEVQQVEHETEQQCAGNDARFAHALHGNAWRRSWQVGARTESSVKLHFEHEPDSRVPGDWPFRYRAGQRIELIGSALRIMLSAQNLAERPMPFRMGHHPYYPRTAQTRWYAEVAAMWHADAEVLPTHLGPHSAVDALRDGMPVDAFDLDNNFANWSREATIAWPDEHRRPTMTADAPFDHMVVFAGQRCATVRGTGDQHHRLLQRGRHA